MPWTVITDDSGRTWSLNQLGLWILVRQNVYNRLLYSHSRVVHEHHFFAPDRTHIETNFHLVREDRERESYPVYRDLALAIQHDGGATRSRLIEMREETEQAVADLREMQRAASHETFSSIERCVSRGQTGLAIATEVRNLSVTTLIIGSSVMTGGASLAVLGAASVLNGVSQYQDTGNIGSAVLQATGTFVVGAIPLGGASLQAGASVARTVGGTAVSYGERYALIVVGATVDAQFTAANALIEGQSAGSALRSASMRFGVDILGGSVGLGLDHMALPVAVRLFTDNLVEAGYRGVQRSLASRHSMHGGTAVVTRALPAVTPPPVTAGALGDTNATLSSGACSAESWVDQIVLHEGPV